MARWKKKFTDDNKVSDAVNGDFEYIDKSAYQSGITDNKYKLIHESVYLLSKPGIFHPILVVKKGARKIHARCRRHIT